VTARRALVTGATGGLGLSLCAALRDAGYWVRATGRSAANAVRLRDISDDFVRGDLLTMDLGALCQSIDVVFHAAALSSPWGPDALFQAINVEATQALLDAAHKAGARSFVFVSSPSIYAALKDQPSLTEESPLPAKSLNAYARTKGEAERLVLAANTTDFKTVALRPRALIGPDDAVLLPRILALTSRGWFPALRGGRALIELTDVRDAARALVLADQNLDNVAGKAINIAGGKPLSVAELVRKLATALKRPVTMRPLPLPFVLMIARLSEIVCGLLPTRPEPRLTVYSVAALAYTQTFDLALARNLLGYTPEYDAIASAEQIATRYAAAP
jgi:nucleoside-diphosphate-sugar epimerase